MSSVKNYRRSFLTFTFSCCLFLFCSPRIYCQAARRASDYSKSNVTETISYPSFEPAFTTGVQSEELTWDQIVSVSLKCSLVSSDSDEWTFCQQAFDRLREQCDRNSFSDLPENVRGEKVLSLLYENTLADYSQFQTKTSFALESGAYNCVSSAVLYLALAKYCGLDVRGQVTSQHAFCSVYLSDGTKVDVETTNPHGYEPGKKKNLPEDSKKWYVVPKSYYASRKEASDLVFISLICQNLCASYNKKNDYASMIPVASASYEMLKNTSGAAEAFRHLNTAVNNYCADLNSRGLCRQVLPYYKSFSDTYGMNEAAASNFQIAIMNVVNTELNGNNLEGASAVLDQYGAYVSDSTKNTIRMQIKERQVYLELSSKGTKSEYIPELYEQVLAASREFPGSQNIASNLRVLKQNYIVLIHNNFAAAANSGDTQKAQRILEEGLAKFPDSQRLLNDRALLSTR